MKTSSLILLTAAALALFPSCRSAKDSAAAAEQSRAAEAAVPFTVMERYFLKNNVNGFAYPIIDTQREFNGLFGAAAAMGEDGRPTEVDFSREFVIAMALPETNVYTDIQPVSLQRTPQGLRLSYRVKRGREMGSTMRPLLMIKANRQYQGEPELVEVK